MKPSEAPARKPHLRPGDILEGIIIELLRKRMASVPGRFLSYKDALNVLVNFRIGHKLGRVLLAGYSRLGWIEQSCGHGIRLVQEAEREREGERK